MTLKEFTILSDIDKLDAIWDAKLKTRKLDGNVLISYHDFSDFFVELKYNVAENRVLQILVRSTD